MESIKIEGLSFTYPERSVPALSDITLSVSSGEFITLCGKSGCGKSTLLRQLKPSLAPHGEKSGVIYFEGTEISALSLREQTELIGFVMQDPESGIVCDKVWHELAFGLESLSLPQSEIRSRVAEMAAFFGIGELFRKNVHELSGGQKQLLNLASVMVMQPRVLILDEPTSQLDPIAAHDFLETVSRLNKELGVTVILSEHRLEEALPLSDRVIVMENGGIMADGSVREVGEELRRKKSDMVLALPTPMRVYYSVESKADGQVPINVREGRMWLESRETMDISFEKKEASDNGIVLEADELWFRYEKDSPDVLKGLSLKIRKNELYAIVGGNGAGKSTALSVLMGVRTPYRGKVNISKGKRAAALPQNPKSLFVKKTVSAELWDMLDGTEGSAAEKETRIDNVIEFCELGGLLDSHPFDLSGGEAQRAALAKVLLCEPDILLLDEPTKGLDAHFKLKLACLLASLKESGMTVIMVSHDIEFCARYADRVGMFFDGSIISEDTPREFFGKKSFYTTSACRMARGVIENAVLDEDIMTAIGGVPFKALPDLPPYTRYPKTKTKPSEKKSVKKEKSPLKKRTIISVCVILLLIPLTVFLGMTFLGDRKYFFTSLAVMLEAMLPFFLIFEGRKPKARELVIISVLCAIAVAGRVAFSFIPQFKPVTALILIAGLCFGGETGFLVGAVTGFVSNFYFSQGPWTPWQMLSWGLIGFFAGILSQSGSLGRKRSVLCIFGFLSTLVIYGGIMNPAHVITTQTNINLEMILASYASGFPMDIVHAVSTFVFLWFAAEPICEKLERVKTKYGLL